MEGLNEVRPEGKMGTVLLDGPDRQEDDGFRPEAGDVRARHLLEAHPAGITGTG